MKERNKAIPASYLILKKDDSILLARRTNTNYYDGYYALPAGHVEAGELPVNALIREAKEELGIDIAKDSISFAHNMYRTKHDETGDRADYYFVVDSWVGEVKNNEPHKCNELQWFAMSELPQKMMPHDKVALEKIQKNIPYSELDLDYIKHINEA